MRTTDFCERVLALYSEKPGGKQVFITGHTAVRHVVLFGNIAGAEARPVLYAAQAAITDITGEREALQVSAFSTDPGARDVAWSVAGSMRRAILRNNTDGVRLIVPAGGNAARIIVDGMSLNSLPNMLPGVEPPQALPPGIEAMSELLVARMLPQDLARAA